MPGVFLEVPTITLLWNETGQTCVRVPEEGFWPTRVRFSLGVSCYLFLFIFIFFASFRVTSLSLSPHSSSA